MAFVIWQQNMWLVSHLSSVIRRKIFLKECSVFTWVNNTRRQLWNVLPLCFQNNLLLFHFFNAVWECETLSMKSVKEGWDKAFHPYTSGFQEQDCVILYGHSCLQFSACSTETFGVEPWRMWICSDLIDYSLGIWTWIFGLVWRIPW